MYLALQCATPRHDVEINICIVFFSFSQQPNPTKRTTCAHNNWAKKRTRNVEMRTKTNTRKSNIFIIFFFTAKSNHVQAGQGPILFWPIFFNLNVFLL